MRITVTGATGFIGKPLVSHLLGAGYEVRGLSRDAKRATRVLPVRCECHEWDFARGLDPSSLSGSDAVIHLAGKGIADRRWTEDHKAQVRASRVATTQAIVGAIRGMPAGERPRVFIAASAIGYYGDRGDEEMREHSGPGHGYLAEVCRAWEDEALRAADLGLRSAAIRIGVVLGKQSGALRQLLPPFRLGIGGRLGAGTHWMSWIHIRDLVRLFHHVLEHHDAAGAINGVAPEPVTNRIFTSELGRVLHRPTCIPIPAWVLRLVLGEMATVLLSSQRVLPASAERLGFQWRFPRLADALGDLCNDLSEEFECEDWIPRPIGEVFAFFADGYNLQKITPPFLNFRVLGTSAPEMGEGLVIRYRLRVRGIPIGWQSRIESWEPGRRFADRQIRGPYRSWHHTHEFEPYESGTIVRDRVRYQLPLGPVGDLVAGRFVARDVRAIFDFRHDRMRDLLGVAQAPA
jgi:uncharacterized protein